MCDGKPAALVTETSSQALNATVKAKWDEGYVLHDAAWGDGNWVGARCGTDGENALSWASTTSEFKERIQKRWDDGWMILSIAIGYD